ncbi:MAG TPA: aquaporin, partial [Intrasporangium sp.]|uniref:aquaporin n=1 Tax=Intrasporangium sp. TaxID=1925024 RepID=UPI002D7687AA
VIGSGIMGTNLTQDIALQLLVNAVATVAALGVLIATLGPVSGAHFNPVVTLVGAVRRDLGAGEATGYALAQFAGGLAGAAVANVMFELPTWQASRHERTGPALWLGEVVATAGLLFTIGAITRTGRGHLGPVIVPAWIGAAYFFTSSTSFANPAVALARSTSDTFAGISPGSVPGFALAQLVGAALGTGLAGFLFPRRGLPEPPDLPETVHAT